MDFVMGKPYVKDVLLERKGNPDAKRQRHLEYTFMDNLTPLKEKLKYDEDFHSRIRGGEGRKKYLYLDTIGVATWGEGFNLSRKRYIDRDAELKALKKVDAYIEGDNRLATDEEKEMEYAKLEVKRKEIEERRAEKIRRGEKVSANLYNVPAEQFANVTNLRFANDTINAEYRIRLDEAIANLERSRRIYNDRIDSADGKYADYKGLTKLQPWGKFSKNKLLALIEMSYNVGSLADWKRMLDALARGDYEMAARESHRDDDNGRNVNTRKRNEWVRSMLLSEE